MAAAASPETVTITINDIELQVPKGELIVESVKRLGLEIPIFCYHPRMKPVGMCRMCLVEVGFKGPDGTIKKMPKPQAGCTLPASEGMAVYTDTEAVHKDRRGVLEFLLANHPLDCPICDRGGECPLQNNTLFYGPSTSRFVELKRHLPKAFPLSKYVTLDLERCIQCGRCVRFTEEISGDSQLAFRFRGANMQPSTFELKDFTSKFSGNVIEICPVGALTSAVYRFRARPWDLETKPAICTVCSNGCNVWFDYRVGKMVRINGRTNDLVNGEWTCDRGKFGHEFYNSEDRLTKPLLRKGDSLQQCEWSDAYAAVLEGFKSGGDKVAALAGANSSNEDLYLLGKLFREQFKSHNLDHRFTKTLATVEQHDLPLAKNSLASYENRPAILVFGTSLADEEPILFLRVRKAWFKQGAKIVVAHQGETDADNFAHSVLRYKPGEEAATAKALLKAAIDAGLKVDAESARLAEGKPDPKLSEAGKLLAQGTPIILTRGLLNAPDALTAIQALAAIGKANGAGTSLYGLEANDQGCENLAILPDTLIGGKPVAKGSRGVNTDQILMACTEGRIEALWLANVDPISKHRDPELVKRALEKVKFLVFQGVSDCEAARYASVVLPMNAPAESDGTFTNLEGRVQRMRRVLAPKGEAKDGWRIFQEVMLRAGTTSRPFFNAREIMEAIAAEAPGYSTEVYGESFEGEPVSPGAERVGV